jgi:hypothetical protein
MLILLRIALPRRLAIGSNKLPPFAHLRIHRDRAYTEPDPER